MDFLSTELGCVYFRCIIYIYKYICENMCCKSLCFVSAFLSLNKQKKRDRKPYSSRGMGLWVHFLSGSSPTLTIGRFVFLFPEVGICAKLCGASAYFSNEQYLCTTVQKIGKLLKECSVIPGDSPELLTASMCQPHFPDHTHKSRNS